MEITKLSGRVGEAGGHYRKMQTFDIPSDFELLGVSHYYGLPLPLVVTMAHSDKRESREALGRMVGDLPNGTLSAALAALRNADDPRRLLKVERRAWQNALRVVSDLLAWIRGLEVNGYGLEVNGYGLTADEVI